MFGVDYFAKKVIEYAFLFLSLQETSNPQLRAYMIQKRK